MKKKTAFILRRAEVISSHDIDIDLLQHSGLRTRNVKQLHETYSVSHGPLTRYIKLRFAHAPGMPGTFPRHHGLAFPTCITARAWRVLAGKTFPAFPRTPSPQIYVFGKKPMVLIKASQNIPFLYEMSQSTGQHTYHPAAIWHLVENINIMGAIC